MNKLLVFLAIVVLSYLGQKFLGVSFAEGGWDWVQQLFGLVLIQLSGLLIKEL